LAVTPIRVIRGGPIQAEIAVHEEAITRIEVQSDKSTTIIRIVMIATQEGIVRTTKEVKVMIVEIPTRAKSTNTLLHWIYLIVAVVVISVVKVVVRITRRLKDQATVIGWL
jgi:hypothetical protein